MYLSTIFKRKLLLAATLLCAGMLSMTAATVADLKPIKSTYVCAFDNYTQNGGVLVLRVLYLGTTIF